MTFTNLWNPQSFTQYINEFIPRIKAFFENPLLRNSEIQLPANSDDQRIFAAFLTAWIATVVQLVMRIVPFGDVSIILLTLATSVITTPLTLGVLSLFCYLVSVLFGFKGNIRTFLGILADELPITLLISGLETVLELIQYPGAKIINALCILGVSWLLFIRFIVRIKLENRSQIAG
jgi:hypothetical protein